MKKSGIFVLFLWNILHVQSSVLQESGVFPPNSTQANQLVVEDICDLPPERGSCPGSYLAYYYDPQTDSCREFRYGGCGGNRNNFPDEESCMRSCHFSEEHGIDEFHCQVNGTFSNPQNCSSFIQCYFDQNRLVSRTVQCPEGKHYSAEAQLCKNKCTAKCDASLENCEPHPDFVCSQDGRYPYLGDCGSYQECSRGTAMRKHCYSGFHYSTETRRCEMPCNARCDVDLACECGWSSCNITNHAQIDVSPRISCSDEDSVLPDPGDCSKFVVCEKGEAYYMHCPHGLHYNRETSRCETPCSAQCDKHIPCFMEKRMCENGPCFECPPEDGEFSDLYDCSIYHRCRNGSDVILSCPPGKLFDHWTSKCLKREKALCVYRCEKLNFTYSYPLDVHSYILCKQGVPYVKRCPEGSTFQAEKGKCMEETEPNVNNVFSFLTSSPLQDSE